LFDRNEFGVFKGTATVVYEKADDAKKAIDEYHGAYLDEKLLTVEYAEKLGKLVPVKGKTLRVGGNRR
jgi:RNA recognition motif-containing protein